MDATHLDTFVDALIDALTPSPVPSEGGDRTLFHLLDSPRPMVDEQPLLAVLAAAVTMCNVVDHVIAQAAATCERLGIPAREHLGPGPQHLRAPTPDAP